MAVVTIMLLIIHQCIQVQVVQWVIMVLDNNQVIHRVINQIMNTTIIMAKPKHLLFPVLLIIHILEIRQFLNTTHTHKTQTRIFFLPFIQHIYTQTSRCYSLFVSLMVFFSFSINEFEICAR